MLMDLSVDLLMDLSVHLLMDLSVDLYLWIYLDDLTTCCLNFRRIDKPTLSI